jgi:hypothetical protein
MKRFATLLVAFGLATAGSTALAEQAKDQVSKQKAKPQPVKMTDAQLDNVAAGRASLIEVDITRNDILRNVNANVQVVAAAAVLGAAGAAQGGPLQRITE